jgi:hypothetical protein
LTSSANAASDFLFPWAAVTRRTLAVGTNLARKIDLAFSESAYVGDAVQSRRRQNVFVDQTLSRVSQKFLKLSFQRRYQQWRRYLLKLDAWECQPTGLLHDARPWQRDSYCGGNEMSQYSGLLPQIVSKINQPLSPIPAIFSMYDTQLMLSMEFTGQWETLQRCSMTA